MFDLPTSGPLETAGDRPRALPRCPTVTLGRVHRVSQFILAPPPMLDLRLDLLATLTLAAVVYFAGIQVKRRMAGWTG